MSKQYDDPELFCAKCQTRLKIESWGRDFIVEPCSCEFDRGWNECLTFNGYPDDRKEAACTQDQQTC